MSNRMATCWLIRRFLDLDAEFILAPADQVASVQNETWPYELIADGG